MPTTTAPRSVALLERAIGFTWNALTHVDDSRLDDTTPCAGWDLRTLLLHMDDSLAAFTEAAALGQVNLRPLAGRHGSDLLVETLRLRACAVLGAWASRADDRPVRLGADRMEPGLLAAVGALEITVHGWDVAQTCGIDIDPPADLAAALYEVAVETVTDADRGVRFGPPRSAGADPTERLLAFLGR